MQKALVRAAREGIRPHAEAPRACILDGPPSLEEPIEELHARKLAMSDRVVAHMEHGPYYTVQVPEAGPYAFLLLGDWHIENDGTAYRWLVDDVQTVAHTDGLYAVHCGDFQDNWIGKLARLHANNSVTARDSWRLVEMHVGTMREKLIAFILGNHDVWSGAGDPLYWIARGIPGPIDPHEVRIRFQDLSGNQISAAIRHKWPGSSVYHKIQGQLKAQRFGAPVDLIIGADKHTSGYYKGHNGFTGKTSHCIQVGAYKINDDYPAAMGMEPCNTSPSVMVVIDPTAGDVGRITVFERDSVIGHAQGLSYLASVRARKTSQGAA